MQNPVVWFEVVGKDGGALQRFYGDLFGWKAESANDGDGSYGLVAAANGGIGGGIGRSPDGGDGHVTFFVEVDDPAVYLQKAEHLGGRTIVPPTTREEFGAPWGLLAMNHLIGQRSGAKMLITGPRMTLNQTRAIAGATGS